MLSASATKYALELFGDLHHFAHLCTSLHIFALGGAESIGGHWLIRLRVAGGCYQHSLGVESRGLVGWCLVVPCLNGVFWLDVAWTSSTDSAFCCSFWLDTYWALQGFFQKIQPLRSIQQGVLYETVTGAEVGLLSQKATEHQQKSLLVVSWILTETTGL